MTTVLLALAAWLVLSVPLLFFVGRFIAVGKGPRR